MIATGFQVASGASVITSYAKQEEVGLERKRKEAMKFYR